MNKKFLSAILFGALMITSTGTFVSCKDYDDDINDLQGQVDTNKSTLGTLTTQLTSLQTALSSAQSTADAAKAAADAAKAAGDTAKAEAEAAKAAAAQAKADAIAEATKQVEALKAIVEANKLSQDELEVLIAAVSGKVDAIDADINALEALIASEDAKVLAQLAAVKADLEEQIAALTAGDGTTTTEEIVAQIETLQANLNMILGPVQILIEEVDNLKMWAEGSEEAHNLAIQGITSAITAMQEDYDTQLAELWAEINGEGANSIRTQVGQLALLINEIDTRLNTLSVLVAPQLGSLTFIPYEIIDGVEGLTYGSFTYNALTLKNKDKQAEVAEAAKTATVVNPTVYAYYHVSPKGIAIDSIKNKLAFTLVKDASYVETRAASSKDFAMTPVFDSYDAATGVLKVKVNVTGTAADADKMTLFALQADQVTSDYAVIQKNDLDKLEIADEKLADKKNPADNHYRRAIKGIDAVDTDAKISNIKPWSDTQTDVKVDTSFVYTESLDLNTIVKAHAVGSKCAVADIEKFGFAWKYEVVKNYGIARDGEPETPQDEFVNLSDEGVLTAKVYETTGRAAIGRTPIIRVSLIDTNNNNAIVNSAYIKVRIVDTDEVVFEESVSLEVDPFGFVCDKDSTNKLSVKEINLKIYNSLGLSFAQFKEKYPNFVDVDAAALEIKGADGKVITEVGTCVESQNTEEGETNVVEWTVKNAELWANAGKTLKNVIRYYDKNNEGFVQFIMTSSVDDIKKSYDIAKADFISNYWNDTKDWTKFNVAVPKSTTDNDPANCTFINNLNAPFTTWPKNSDPTKKGQGVPGVLKLDASITSIQYFFCKDVEDIKKIGTEGNEIDVIFTISTDGLKLYAQKKAADAPQLVATINNSGATDPNTIEYNKASDLAKELLNTGAMYTYIGAKGLACEDKDKEVAITFDGKDHFQANFIRPVNIAKKSADNFIDGVDFGEKGSFIRLEDLIDPYDWRKRYFADYENYWGYYGNFSVEVDIANAECNLNGTRQAVPVTVVLEQAAAGTMGTGADALTSDYGFLTYKNNGTKVSAFEIYVKVEVTYGWGVILTDWITVKVDSTITNN